MMRHRMDLEHDACRRCGMTAMEAVDYRQVTCLLHGFVAFVWRRTIKRAVDWERDRLKEIARGVMQQAGAEDSA